MGVHHSGVHSDLPVGASKMNSLDIVCILAYIVVGEVNVDNGGRISTCTLCIGGGR